jgi:HTH-type transcriptional regulator / antitoxin HigA
MQNTIKSNGKMTSTINRTEYIELLERDRIVPKIIETAEEYDRFLAVVERMLFEKQQHTAEETALFRLLVKLIKDYEEETYNLKEWSQTAPNEMLKHLMEARGLKQVDLVGVLSLSKGLVSSIINGRREISKTQAKKTR